MERKYDPVENTDEYKRIENELDEKLAVYIDELKKESERIFEEFGIMPSICHRVWLKKKEILHDDYGIEWKTPVEMNPGVNFD